MISLEEIEHYSYLLTLMDDKKKKNNIKFHIVKQVKEEKWSDSQLLLFDILVQKEKEVLRLKDAQTNIIDNSKYLKVIQDMKQDTEKQRRTNTTDYENMYTILTNDIDAKDNIHSEYYEAFEQYKDSIGHEINNFMRALNDGCPKTRTIYSRTSYNDLIIMVTTYINKEPQGVRKMRLETYLNEYKTDKNLKNFR